MVQLELTFDTTRTNFRHLLVPVFGTVKKWRVKLSVQWPQNWVSNSTTHQVLNIYSIGGVAWMSGGLRVNRQSGNDDIGRTFQTFSTFNIQRKRSRHAGCFKAEPARGGARRRLRVRWQVIFTTKMCLTARREFFFCSLRALHEALELSLQATNSSPEDDEDSLLKKAITMSLQC